LDYKDIEIRKSEFVAKTHLLNFSLTWLMIFRSSKYIINIWGPGPEAQVWLVLLNILYSIFQDLSRRSIETDFWRI